MGSLFSRPKAPPLPKPLVITVPAYVPPPVPVYTAPPPAAGDEETPATARSAGLLDRNRGMFSTVLTGFRGLLNENTAGTRKTLLGE